MLLRAPNDNVPRIRKGDENVVQEKSKGKSPWRYTRPNNCHLLFDLSTLSGNFISWKTRSGSDALSNILPKCVIKFLCTYHSSGASSIGHSSGEDGNLPNTIQIWKEIYHKDYKEEYVRAFHDFDQFRQPYFDWISIRVNENDDDRNYRIAKVVLLYRHQGEDLAVVWMARAFTHNEIKLENCISAHWQMEVAGASKSPVLRSYSQKSIKGSVYVLEHWQSKSHLPSADERTGKEMTVTEVYDREAWAWNFFDEKRWMQRKDDGTEDDSDDESSSGNSIGECSSNGSSTGDEDCVVDL